MSAFAFRLLTGVDRRAENQRPVAYTTRETVLVLIACLAFVGGLIHVGAGVDHYGEYHLYTVVFCGLAVVQTAWAVLLLRGPSRPVVALGAVFQLGVVAVWVLSRTVGVPIAPHPWVPEEVGVADLVATIGELATVFGVGILLAAPRMARAQRVSTMLAPALLAVLIVSVLFGTGAHAG